ncbi:MAG: transglycosylase SLT domain-containing protein, partial [Alphaproteobacteria bacterium]
MSVATIDLSSLTGDSVTQALAKASRATGVDFSYLLNTAKRESSLNPDAKSKTSSATGLFQFVEQTWLQALKAHGTD